MRTFSTLAASALAIALALAACEGSSEALISSPSSESNLSPQAALKTTLGPQAVVISQVYGGGSVTSPFNADFVELHNTTNQTVMLNGLSLQYGGATGTSWGAKINLPDAGIRAGGYFLIRTENPGASGTPVPADFVSAAISMGQSNGKIALVDNTTAMPSGACPTSAAMDFLGYGTANCSETLDGGNNPAPATSTTLSLERRDNGCADTDSNRADFVLRGFQADGGGTAINPRNSFSAAVVCGQVVGPDGGVVVDGGVVDPGPCGGACTATQCCDATGGLGFCVEVGEDCFNGDVCSSLTFECEEMPVVEPEIDGGVRAVGSRCTTDAECQASLGATSTCKRQTSQSGVPYSNGYCTKVNCTDPLSSCPVGSTCRDPSIYGEETMCWDDCGIGDPCRPGYSCKQDLSHVNLGCWIDPTPPIFDGGSGGGSGNDGGAGGGGGTNNDGGAGGGGGSNNDGGAGGGGGGDDGGSGGGGGSTNDAGSGGGGGSTNDAGSGGGGGSTNDAGSGGGGGSTNDAGSGGGTGGGSGGGGGSDDAGTTPVDAGSPAEDAGTNPPVDSGTPVVDSGTPVVDSGTPVVDSGTPVVDSGTPTVDAGTEADAGSMNPADAGKADAGMVKVDAGTVKTDAGKVDAGVKPTPIPDPAPMGCGCSSTDVGLMLPFALAALALRRRRRS